MTYEPNMHWFTKPQCEKMVKTTPEPRDTDRHPPDHRCERPEWKDGLCKLHHPDDIAEKAAERQRMIACHQAHVAKKAEFLSEVDSAILLLVKNGYRVEKV